jgi:hypothetical protein
MKPFVISRQPMLIGEILRRNAAREKFKRMFGGGRVHRARLGDHEQVESNLPLPQKPTRAAFLL